MKILISPAKSLDFDSELSVKDFSKPFFEKESNLINSKLKIIAFDKTNVKFKDQFEQMMLEHQK